MILLQSQNRKVYAQSDSSPTVTTSGAWQETEYPPTCEEAGRIIRENLVEGYTVIDQGQPALGHNYGEWVQNPGTGVMERACIRCGKIMQRLGVYKDSIPRIDLIGNLEGISKSNRITLAINFSSQDENFSCYAYTTWQGHNSLIFPKKNYTIRLYDDKNITKKHKISFFGWQREHKYVLKANYRDFSQLRNLIAANLWAEMVACRFNLFETLKHTSNYGAVDGFPVVVFLNNEFHGLYTMNLHIDDDLYQMNHPYDAIMIANSSEPEECRFYAEATFMDQKNAWEVEYCGTGEDDHWAKNSLNELIRFVKKSDDKTFQEHLKDYIDVDAAIDYLIFLYVTGLQDNAGKDLILLKYHDCDSWIPTVYDMEHAFGLDLDGTSYNMADVFLPEMREGNWNSGTNSLLWDRLLQSFCEQIKTRYTELQTSLGIK